MFTIQADFYVTMQVAKSQIKIGDVNDRIILL